jgi:hypothetical protein
LRFALSEMKLYFCEFRIKKEKTMPRKYRDCENNRKDGKVDYACGIETRGKIVKKKGKNCVAGRGNIDYVCGTKSKGADVKE